MAISTSILVPPFQLPSRFYLHITTTTTTTTTTTKNINYTSTTTSSSSRPSPSSFSHSLTCWQLRGRVGGCGCAGCWMEVEVVGWLEVVGSSSRRGMLLLPSAVRADEGGGVETAADVEEEEEEDQKEEIGLAALQHLDSQLRALSQGDHAPNSSSSSSASSSTPPLQRKEREIQPAKDRDTSTAWPEFTPEFMAYAGVGLLILTLINNILYFKFVEPPVKPQRSEKVEAQLREMRMRKFAKKAYYGDLKLPSLAPDSR